MELERYAKPLLRISLAFVFLYFGIQQIINVENWISFVPSFALLSGVSVNNLILVNAFLELGLGGLLLLGLYTRISSLILSINLFLIAFSIGFNPLGIRDFGLAFATLAVFLNGHDKFCLENKFS